MSVDVSLILESLGPAKRFADPSGPVPGRMMAASGALPLPPEQIATVLFCLSHDPEEPVREKAAQSLADLPDRVLEVALRAEIPGPLLAHFADVYQDNAHWLEAISLNAATPDETYVFLAGLSHGGLVDIVSRNQTRLLRCPGIVDALSENPATSQATIDRVLEFLGIRSDSGAEAIEGPDVPEPAPDTEAEDATVFDPDDPEGLPEDLLHDDEDEDGEEPDEEKIQSLYARVQDMNVMEKVKLARFGNGDARALLIRDRNKVVCTAAINSPKVKESEVLAFAKSRSLSDEILRIIANNREWTRSYGIKQALVRNPKTPLPSAIKFVNYLTDRDLREIMRSRDVPGQIATQARRILARKGKV